MSLLNTKMYAGLKDGIYKVSITNAVETEAKVVNGGVTTSSYVTISGTTDDGRQVKFNLFEKGLKYFISALNARYTNFNEYTAVDVLGNLPEFVELERRTNVVNNTAYTNWYVVRESSTSADAEGATVDTDIEEALPL